MKKRKRKGIWIADILWRIVSHTGIGVFLLASGILMPDLEVQAVGMEHQREYQQEQEQQTQGQQPQDQQEQQTQQQQQIQPDNEVDNYLTVMLENYDLTGLDEELAVYFPDLSIHADGIMKMLLDGKVQEVLKLFRQ